MCFLIHPAFDWANNSALANETPKGTATRTPLNGLTETLICLARRLRSIFMVPTLFNSTVFASTLDLTLRLSKILATGTTSDHTRF
jgi:hypothetical protein